MSPKKALWRKVSKLVLVLFLISQAVLFGFKGADRAEAANMWFVKEGGAGDCSSWANACGNILTAISTAAEGDTIAVKAGSYSVVAPIIVDKPLSIIGYKSDEITPAFDLYETGEVDGPDLTVGGDIGTVFLFDANEIHLSGFHIDTTFPAAQVSAIWLNGEVKYPVIEYNRFDFEEADSAIYVGPLAKLVAPAGINFNVFNGPVNANAFWFQVDTGGSIDFDLGFGLPNEFGYSFFDLSFYHNSINQSGALFQLANGIVGNGIKHIIFLYNTFSNSQGFVIFDEIGDAATTAKLDDIYFMYNTFNNSPTLDNQYAILLGDGLDNDDVADGWDEDFIILFNKFNQARDDTYPTVGFTNAGLTNPTGSILAWANWWGSADGPTNFTTGSAANATVSDHINFNPWATASNLSGLFIDASTFADVELGQSSFLPSQFTAYLKQGSFIVPLPSYISDPETMFDEEKMLGGEDDYNYDITKPPYLDVYRKVVFEIPNNGGNIVITIPDDTRISPATGNEIDISKLLAQAKLTSALTGLPSGSEVFGAAELGIPNLGLNFSKSVEIKIYVGTSLNGRTLSVRRSISGTGDWTTEGIEVSDCTINEGYCTFQTTKASNFAVANIPSSQILPETGAGAE
ncbi:MAG: hypothetical protein OEV37_00865 [Candidatus Berkelbacteria bacterium]|nr:hypothetical protein [Candidatus Berkelbacteria bacterium]